MNHTQKIGLKDTIFDIVSKLSEGNAGAQGAVLDIITQGNRIDKDNPMGGIGAALLLDTFGIYGKNIYILHADICDKNTSRTIALLRATQLGILDQYLLKKACEKEDYTGREMIPVEDLYLKVKTRLKNFNT